MLAHHLAIAHHVPHAVAGQYKKAVVVGACVEKNIGYGDDCLAGYAQLFGACVRWGGGVLGCDGVCLGVLGV